MNLQDIQEAHNRLKEANVIVKVPFAFSQILSDMTQSSIYLKQCNVQNTGAFKIRGAFNKIALLSTKERSQGVIAASAGNHAQGVAFSARHFSIPAVIVMPENTPLMKVNGTRQYGAEVVLKGANYDEAFAYATQLAQERHLTFVHPFADEAVMVGQGTVALEMLEKIPDLTTLLVPVGGGGLISGIAVAAKSLKKSIRIIGVSSKGAPALRTSFKSGVLTDSTSVRTIADGIAVRDTSEVTLNYIQEYVDDIIEVDDEEIANAILFLLEKHKIVIEGAGSVGVAALLHGIYQPSNDEKVGVVLSGGNIDVTMLSVIIEKGLMKSNRKMKLIVTLIDKPGSLRQLTDILTDLSANIVHIEYDRANVNLAYGDANVTLELETKGSEHQESILTMLKKSKYNFQLG